MTAGGFAFAFILGALAGFCLGFILGRALLGADRAGGLGPQSRIIVGGYQPKGPPPNQGSGGSSPYPRAMSGGRTAKSFSPKVPGCCGPAPPKK